MAQKEIEMAFLPQTINDLCSGNVEDLIGKERTVFGWAKSCRIQNRGNLLFVSLQDGTTLTHVQSLLFRQDFDDATFAQLSEIKTGWSLRFTGTFVKSPAKGQLIELKVSNAVILGKCPSDYILQKHSATESGASFDTLRQFPHLRCRSTVFQSINRIRNKLMRSTHELFGSHGFVWAATPLITFSDCEGAGEAFLVKTTYPRTELPEGGFFGQQGDGFLTVSGQLEGEMMAMVHSRIYTFGPTFRAEKSKTSRHLAEFWMIEPEVCFVSLDQLIQLACAYVVRCVSDILKECTEDVKITLEYTLKDKFSGKELYEEQCKRIDQLMSYTQKPFAVISYTQAISELENAVEGGHTFVEPVFWGVDMSSEHEKYLTDVVHRTPVVVHSYPAEIKAFYMKRYTTRDTNTTPNVDVDTRCVQSFDLLVPGIGELIGGSIREHDLELLTNVMKSKDMDLTAYQPYLDLRLFGTVPHGGFGLGFERLVQFVTGIHHIQDCIPFPRAY
jgi:asparaginyl-tRNA synthetase